MESEKSLVFNDNLSTSITWLLGRPQHKKEPKSKMSASRPSSQASEQHWLDLAKELRHKCVEEIFTTEKSYVTSLTTLVTVSAFI